MALLKYFRKVSNDNIALASASSGLKEAAENEVNQQLLLDAPQPKAKKKRNSYG